MNYSSDETKEFFNRLEKLGIRLHSSETVLYKYTNIDSAIRILDGGTLLYQNPNLFNDPFELTSGLLDIQQLNENYYWNSVYNKHTPAEIEILKNTTTKKQLEENAERVLDMVRSQKGILCMSKTMKHTLMWSHYADKHAGVCLGFKFPFSMPTEPIVAFDVKYSDSIVARKMNDFSESADSLISIVNWMCTKAKVWEYEKEVRLINMVKYGIIPFANQELCEVYFGCATSEKDIDAISSLIRTKNYNVVKLAKMKINPKQFDLHIDDVTHL